MAVHTVSAAVVASEPRQSTVLTGSPGSHGTPTRKSAAAAGGDWPAAAAAARGCLYQP